MEWMLMPYRKLYRLIEGRSGRREFWMFTLFVWIVTIAMIVLLGTLFGASSASFGDDFTSANYSSAMAGAGVGALILVLVLYVWMVLTGVASFAVSQNGPR